MIVLVTLLLTLPISDFETLQPRHGYSLLMELVDSLPELFEGTVLRQLHVVDLQNLKATCRLLRRVTGNEALAAGTQAREPQKPSFSSICSQLARMVL